MTSVYNIGCFLGALSTIWTGDILGRPRQILLGSTVIGLGAIIQTASWSVAQMLVGRVVAGLGTGMNTATAGVWQAETSKMNSRGKLVIIQMGPFGPFNFSLFSTDKGSHLHHLLQHLQLAYPRLFLRPARHCLSISPRFPALLHPLYICNVSVSSRFASSPHQEGQA